MTSNSFVFKLSGVTFVVVLIISLVCAPFMVFAHEGEDHTEDDDGYASNTIHFEVHGGRTHVHYVNEDGEESGFFIDYDVSDTEHVIEAIMEETDLSRATIEEIADFEGPAEARMEKMETILSLLVTLLDLLEHQLEQSQHPVVMEEMHTPAVVAEMPATMIEEHHEDEHEEHHEGVSYEGLHIMTDGSVMLMDGSTLEGATVNADGMVVLPNGGVVKPLMDMR